MQKALMLVLAGVAIGLLVAPEKGTDTQRKVSNWLSGKTEDAKDKIGEAGDILRSKARSVKNDLMDAKDEVRDGMRDATKSWS